MVKCINIEESTSLLSLIVQHLRKSDTLLSEMKGTALLLLCGIALAQASKYMQRNALQEDNVTSKRNVIDDNDYNGNCNPEEASTICAVPNSDGILVAHENCDKFYKCANGKPVATQCPDNLLYNPHKEYCDWASAVECGNRVISQPDDSSDDNNNGNCNCNPEEAPTICAGSESDGILVTHENCDKFYKCANGKPVAIQCPDNLLYNPHKEYCDWASAVECGNRVISQPDDSSDDNNNGNCNCNPEEAPTICAGSDSDGILVAHENCDKFYKCANGKPVAIQCPDNLLYNPHKEYCDWASAVECGNRVISQPEDSSDDNNNGNCNCNPEEAPTICAGSESDGILVAHENCDKFYKCANGKPVAIQCPDNLLYNPHKEYCDWASAVECGYRVISQPDDSSDDNNNGNCNCNPEEAPTICAGSESDGILVTHENCDKFYKCANGKPVAIQCPDNLLYNPHKEYCDWASAVECGNRVISQPDDSSDDNNNGNCNCNPEEAPTICAGSDSDGILVAHENCDKFYKCANGKPVAIQCPNNLLYNPYKEYCDWASAVECGNRVISQPDESSDDNNNGNCNCNPEEAPIICAGSDSDGILVAHENCAEFYKCANGKPVAIQCPNNLFYNPYKEYCDWASAVECGNRVISQPDDSSDDNNNGNCTCNPEEAPTICAGSESDGILVTHENCDKFYKCANGKPVAIQCPDNLLYNPHKEYCDWASAVECGNRVISQPDDSSDDNNNGNCNCNPEEAPTICAGSDSDGILVAHENCDKFYKCANGKPVAIQCPNNLLYNPYKEYCDWASAVECGNRVISQPDESSDDNNNGNCNCNPEEAPTICADSDSDGILVAHENCDKFYKCTNGKPVAIQCPDNLLYNSHKEYCDWTSAVECGNRVISKPGNGTAEADSSNVDSDSNGDCNCNPEEAPAICAHPDSDGIFIAHKICNKLYICARGQPVALTCPKNTFYNPHKGICDLAGDTECGDRVISFLYE